MLRNPSKFDAAQERHPFDAEPARPLRRALAAEVEAREFVWRGRAEFEIRAEMDRAVARRLAGRYRRSAS